ncbi:uncharacterized protein LOC115484941 [Serinus canaria]|uniref:uncharacterized protein LOC115484941 n=1 Tax=Serinus canaria TaxID=9135 RepID=UPI0021CCDE38|nr:uncharacterized protein LOC115484941 [Serinus canaria]XP_050827999.1 uncharacterized protein LOC115484941 [Serinus canaria]XP_050828000.1 uncharacterized protein LOC115484941 [Serinus canaria]XP_050828001.1 uncharacterized protein LOC115484941 [Serinus canaria]XP_050828002.1 uncharacterized protein LOC115484941 [Serinus canaria]XP_050828003.1 uncharacterized protein LOC115484941 [Serinus canaria]XP_050828004.1 uncharacterized protein LOC115484941 [Serinus canaria]XP_050828005.1 uncharacte
MFFLPWRRRKRPENPPGAAGARQPQPGEFSTRSRYRRSWQGWTRLCWQDGMRHSRGAGDTGRESGIAGEAGDRPGWEQVNGKEPGSLRTGGARQEQPEVRSSPSAIQALGKDFGDKAGVPRQARNKGMDRPRRRAPQPPRAGSKEDEEGKPSGNSQSQEKDMDSGTRNGNVPREGMDRPLLLPSFRVVSREGEEGEPSGNSQSQDTWNGNVPREGIDRPLLLPSFRVVSREGEEGKPSGNSQSREKDSGTRNGNVSGKGMDRPLLLPSFRVVSREGEEGKPSGNSQSQEKDSGTRNGNVPREGMDRPLLLPSFRVVSREDEEGKPSGNSQSREKDSGTRNGNVSGKGMDRPRRRAPLPPPRAGKCEDEEGEPGSNSQSRERGTATAFQNGNVPREGRDRPPPPPRAGSREGEEGEPGSNSQSRGKVMDMDKDSATAFQNGNVTGEGMDEPVCVPSFTVISREGEEGELSGNSQSRDTWNGNVPREGMDEPVCVPPLWVEEGEPSSHSRSRGRDTDAAPTPGRDRRTEPLSGEERREWLWQRLRRLGEDMEGWEGKPTAELAAGLARRITGTPPGRYPAEPGTDSARRERGSGASPDHGDPGRIYRSLLGMLRASGSTESTEEDSGLGSGSGSDREQSSGASRDRDTPSVNYGSLLGMLRAGGNAEGTEEDSGLGWEQSSGASPDHSAPGRNFGCFIGMLSASGNAENAEEGSEQEQAAVKVGREWDPNRLDRRFQEVWARSWLDCGRVAKEEKLDGGPVPFQPQRRLRPHEEQQVAELLEEYLREGIVVEGTSISNNPLILYQKPHGRGARLSLDCTALNAATPVEPQEPLDRDRILTSINPRSRFFSVLDLSNACLAIPLAPSCWGRFAFTFGDRQFLFTRLPPKFHGTSSILQRRVAAMLAQLEPDAARGVFHYSDDILITGKRRRQVRFRTRRVLELIQKTGFKVNRDKAQLVQPEVNYLGLTLSASGRRVQQEKLLQICGDCDAAGPWDPTRLRSVLGKFNDLKEFIPDYLELALPLQRLAAPGKREWEQEREWQRRWEREGGREQLQRLKEALKAAPALLFPNKSQPFVIRLSVHEQTVGAVLLQEKEGTLRPVRHWSSRLRGQGWAPWDAWCLAAVWAVQAFQKLTGPDPILIRGPDGRYLLRGEPLLNGYSGNPELPERWRLLVTTKGPELQESQTVSIPLAPQLRQLPPDIPNANVWFLALERGWSGKPTVAFAAASLEERWLLGLRQGPEEEEAALEALRELLEQHRSRRPLFLYSSCPRLAARLQQPEPDWSYGDDAGTEVLRWLRSFPGMLHIRQVGTRGNAAPEERRWMRAVSARARGVRARGAAENSAGIWKAWEPSASERREIVARCHRHRHDGEAGTLLRVRNVRPWENDAEDVTRWVRRRPECQCWDPDHDPAPQREEGPWSRLRISICSLLPVSPEGFRALLLVQGRAVGLAGRLPAAGAGAARGVPGVAAGGVRALREGSGGAAGAQTHLALAAAAAPAPPGPPGPPGAGGAGRGGAGRGQGGAGARGRLGGGAAADPGGAGGAVGAGGGAGSAALRARAAAGSAQGMPRERGRGGGGERDGAAALDGDLAGIPAPGAERARVGAGIGIGMGTKSQELGLGAKSWDRDLGSGLGAGIGSQELGSGSGIGNRELGSGVGAGIGNQELGSGSGIGNRELGSRSGSRDWDPGSGAKIRELGSGVGSGIGNQELGMGVGAGIRNQEPGAGIGIWDWDWEPGAGIRSGSWDRDLGLGIKSQELGAGSRDWDPGSGAKIRELGSGVGAGIGNQEPGAGIGMWELGLGLGSGIGIQDRNWEPRSGSWDQGPGARIWKLESGIGIQEPGLGSGIGMWHQDPGLRSGNWDLGSRSQNWDLGSGSGSEISDQDPRAGIGIWDWDLGTGIWDPGARIAIWD